VVYIFYFFTLSEGPGDDQSSLFFVFVDHTLFSHFLSIQYHVHTPSQEDLCWAEVSCSGEASLSRLLIKRETC